MKAWTGRLVAVYLLPPSGSRYLLREHTDLPIGQGYDLMGLCEAAEFRVRRYVHLCRESNAKQNLMQSRALIDTVP